MTIDDPWWMYCRKMLEAEEGKENDPYEDTMGNLTIGVGHNLDAVPLSDEIIYAILDEDIQRAIYGISRTFGPAEFDSFSDVRQHALVNLVFNVGETKFKTFHKLIAAIKARNWRQAAYEALDSKWAKQVPERAKRVAYMLEHNDYPPTALD